MDASEAPLLHHVLTIQARMLKGLSVPGDVLRTRAQTSAACRPHSLPPHEDPLHPLLPGSVLFPPLKLSNFPPCNPA